MLGGYAASRFRCGQECPRSQPATAPLAGHRPQTAVVLELGGCAASRFRCGQENRSAAEIASGRLPGGRAQRGNPRSQLATASFDDFEAGMKGGLSWGQDVPTTWSGASHRLPMDHGVGSSCPHKTNSPTLRAGCLEGKRSEATTLLSATAYVDDFEAGMSGRWRVPVFRARLTARSQRGGWQS